MITENNARILSAPRIRQTATTRLRGYTFWCTLTCGDVVSATNNVCVAVHQVVKCSVEILGSILEGLPAQTSGSKKYKEGEKKTLYELGLKRFY